ncbi:ATP-dependent nuclease [Dongia deserti]|uniref:ATP-dependent nuclease n=1 Tax=Dongia deserti TaxID=2268030 RepID=UPI0013C43C63|nr:AAA family ATPase [Dongia deserti]
MPKLMVIAGPNGSGKSTLLHAIRSQNGYSHIMYVGPHRAMRRQQVQQRHLLAPSISFETLLSAQSIPGFEGIRIFDAARDPWSYDDSANYLKHALCQVEVDRQQAITAKVDREGGIESGTLVDCWKPLRELTQNLLPHMSFLRIDATNRDKVKVLWSVHGLESPVDLDDLSSGEKSIVQMFYPLIEREVKALVKEVESGPQAVERPELCVLIDEPELHLHPNLQLKVLDYLRVLTSKGHTQVILATHSPTMVEYASFEELFLLRPIELVEPQQNQLVQVATDEERLQFLRDVFGTTSNLTALQPVVIVEGVAEDHASKVLPDRKLYRALHRGFDHVTLIPGGGKGECKALLRVLGNALKDFSSQLRAVALLDRDTDVKPDDQQIELLPVSMIENFLLDPNAIWEAIQSVLEKTAFRTVDDVSNALDQGIADLEEAEVGRRTALNVGSSHFHPPSEAAKIETEAKAYVMEVTNRYAAAAITAAQAAAKQKVLDLRNANRRREEFHGKAVLQEFYKKHLHQSGIPKVVFTFEAARHARRRRAVVSFFDTFFAKLEAR